MVEEEIKKDNKNEEEPDFGKIIIATVIGILILGGITYAGYKYSQKKAGNITLPGGTTYLGSASDCENCVGGTQKRFEGWDVNNNGKIDDCKEACIAYWGPGCDGNSVCANPGSTNAGACCTCLTAGGDSCSTLPTATAAPTPSGSETESTQSGTPSITKTITEDLTATPTAGL